MCEHCRNIQTWRKFDAPKDYLACIAYIQQLVSEGEFELMQEESTCPLEKVKTEDGWADEIMAHMIRCKHCGQIFTCVVNTWRGSEHFRKVLLLSRITFVESRQADSIFESYITM